MPAIAALMHSIARQKLDSICQLCSNNKWSSFLTHSVEVPWIRESCRLCVYNTRSAVAEKPRIAWFSYWKWLRV